jgi:hypothetical protein
VLAIYKNKWLILATKTRRDFCPACPENLGRMQGFPAQILPLFIRQKVEIGKIQLIFS